MHPAAKHLLRSFYATGVKAVGRALDAVFEDVDAGAREVSSRTKRARSKIKDIETRAEKLRDAYDDDATEED
jgi:hypothetical protein